MVLKCIWAKNPYADWRENTVHLPFFRPKVGPTIQKVISRDLANDLIDRNYLKSIFQSSKIDLNFYPSYINHLRIAPKKHDLNSENKVTKRT